MFWRKTNKDRLAKLEKQLTDTLVALARMKTRVDILEEEIEGKIDNRVDAEVQRHIDDLDLSDFLPEGHLEDLILDTLAAELEHLRIIR